MIIHSDFTFSFSEISRTEKIRRRNVRLSKILQPKNAVKIFNELTKNSNYDIKELEAKPNGYQFKASVLHEGVEHEGYGKLLLSNVLFPHGVNRVIVSLRLLSVTPVEDKVV